MPKFLTILRLTAPASVLAGLTMAVLLMQASFAQPVYPTASNARSDIASALQQAASSHKRVLVEFGANWCTDCKALDANFHNTENADLLSSHFILVHVNVGDSGIDHNLDLAQSYGIPLKNGVPALAVLDSDGHVVFSQKNGEFEAMSRMDPKSVNEFLTHWAQ
jgi:thiol:disulfide interchange protein